MNRYISNIFHIFLIFFAFFLIFSSSEAVHRCDYLFKREGCGKQLKISEKECWNCFISNISSNIIANIDEIEWIESDLESENDENGIPTQNTWVYIGNNLNPRSPLINLNSNLDFDSLFLFNCRLIGQGFNISLTNQMQISRTSTLELNEGSISISSSRGFLLNNGSLTVERLKANLILNNQEITLGRGGLGDSTEFINSFGSFLYFDPSDSGGNYSIDGIIKNWGEIRIVQYASDCPKLTQVFSPLSTGRLMNYEWSSFRLESIDEIGEFHYQMRWNISVSFNSSSIVAKQSKSNTEHSPLIFSQLESVNSNWDCSPACKIEGGRASFDSDSFESGTILRSSNSRLVMVGNLTIESFIISNNSVLLHSNTLRITNQLNVKQSDINGMSSNSFIRANEIVWNGGKFNGNNTLMCTSGGDSCHLASITIEGQLNLINTFNMSGNIEGNGRLYSSVHSSVVLSEKSIWNVNQMEISRLILDFERTKLKESESFLSFKTNSKKIGIEKLFIRFGRQVTLDWGKKYWLLSSTVPLIGLKDFGVVGRHSTCLFPDFNVTFDSKRVSVSYDLPLLPSIQSVSFEQKIVRWKLEDQDCIQVDNIEVLVKNNTFVVPVEDDVAVWDSSQETNDICSVYRLDVTVVGRLSGESKIFRGPVSSYFVQSSKINEHNPEVNLTYSMKHSKIEFKWDPFSVYESNRCVSKFRSIFHSQRFKMAPDTHTVFLLKTKWD
eukprot:TRINITY_DN3566_c0_g1_i2.p1 TRINITY_DN3566_c0_g1~~TRINITY_DN3566_c0_g1_i2.p1  ORF type:complete len:757 (+),score=193.01 TRINITY_DN3566_c0_g1_i2:102-2273(+)